METQQHLVEKTHQLISNIETVIKGKQNQIIRVVTCLLAGGHILLEDNPGTGKTVLAKTLAASLGEIGIKNFDFKRVQFTPDILPMDLLGSYIYDEKNHDFIFKKGPLFTNILLADEINRASPKVQSALLECMAEHQITMGDKTFPLEKIFFTIATQNPIEMEGTYPLPAAQLDRFFMKIFFGYVDENVELDIYNSYLQIESNFKNLQPVLTMNDIIEIKKTIEQVIIHPEIVKSVSNLVRNTRTNDGIALGASPRSGIILLKCLKAFAFIQNRTYVIEDDIAQIAHEVLNHRLIFKNKEAEKNGLQLLIQHEITRLTKLNLY
ncbi:MAG: MoxR family ATPase [Chitinophagaceae bacterium]|nr:MoxR family ATPase [Chitinophagaceae bacterium]